MRVLVITGERGSLSGKNLKLWENIQKMADEHPEFNIKVEFKSADDLYNDKGEYDCCVFDEVSEYPVKSIKRGVNKPYYRSKERW